MTDFQFCSVFLLWSQKVTAQMTNDSHNYNIEKNKESRHQRKPLKDRHADCVVSFQAEYTAAAAAARHLQRPGTRRPADS